MLPCSSMGNPPHVGAAVPVPEEVPSSTAEAPLIYEDDVVCLKSDRSRIGLVDQLGWTQMMDDDGGQENEDEDKLQPDEISVCWENDEDYVKAQDVEVIDRSFLHGDIASKKDDMQGQSGTVVGVRELVDLRFPSMVVYGVPTQYLKSVHRFQQDTYVVQGSWLGQIIDCVVDVKIEFADGSVCLISRPGQGDIIYVHPDSEEDEDEEIDQYYPSQKVSVPSRILKKAKWIKGSFKSQSQGIVVTVDPVEVEVEWITTTQGGIVAPSNFCLPDTLTPLEHFSYSQWEVGDKAMCPTELRVAQTLQKFEQLLPGLPVKGEKAEAAPKSKKPKVNRLKADAKNCATIICTRTFVDICWQDGTISTEVPTKDLVPVENILDEDFWPEDFVLEKADQKKLGVILKVTAKERTCKVLWLDGTKPEVELEEVEDIPIYSLMGHPDFAFGMSDVVVLLPKEEQQEGSSSTANIGEITAIKRGRIQVFWANETTSWVGPHEIYKIDDDEQGQDNMFDYDDAEGEIYDSSEDEQVEQFPSGQPSGAAWWREEEDSLFSLQKEISATYGNVQPQQPQAAPPTQEPVSVKASAKSEENLEGIDQQLLPFDVVETVEQHYYKEKEPGKNISKLANRIVQEWDLLKKNLPEGVYVRVFEDRMDLLKFLVVGPKGTPYWDCVFMFDIYLPSDYPHAPPLLHYYSFNNSKLNPNLYQDGRVCISLLGTWSGRGSENWTPSSNILQLVTSVQGLILGASFPYFLEAGYDKLKGTQQGEFQARLYNESSFLFALETIPVVMQNPPPIFEAIIRKHFHERGQHILDRCEAFISPEGKGKDEEEKTAEPKGNIFMTNPSLGFQKALQNLLPKLKDTFNANNSKFS